jgi:hypothetical protein
MFLLMGAALGRVYAGQFVVITGQGAFVDYTTFDAAADSMHPSTFPNRVGGANHDVAAILLGDQDHISIPAA